MQAVIFSDRPEGFPVMVWNFILDSVLALVLRRRHAVAVVAMLVCGLARGADGKATDWAAEVVFVSGSCRWSAPGLASQALSKGQRLPAGARIEAGADGHAYLTTADRGFLALRPDTAARIARYDAAENGTVDIRLVLERGAARVISGAAARRAPAGFRMETPLAVIGVRGTDFSVRTEADLTQVSVRSGGVVVSALSAACRAAAAGPCEGSSAMELFARESGRMIEVRSGALPLKLLAPAGGGPDGKSPPASDENRHLEPQQGSKGTTATLPAASLEVQLEAGITAALSAANAPVLPPTPPPPPPTIFWGRWSGSGSPASDLERFQAVTGGRERVAMNSWFVLAREEGTPMLPRDGQVTLGLAGAEALIVSQTGQVLASAQVDNGRLLLDFGRQRFETSLTTQGGGYTANFRGAGAINADGTFNSNWRQGTTGSLSGAIEPAARGAGYIYSQPISGTQAVATGVTRWVR